MRLLLGSLGQDDAGDQAGRDAAIAQQGDQQPALGAGGRRCRVSRHSAADWPAQSTPGSLRIFLLDEAVKRLGRSSSWIVRRRPSASGRARRSRTLLGVDERLGARGIRPAAGARVQADGVPPGLAGRDVARRTMEFAARRKGPFATSLPLRPQHLAALGVAGLRRLVQSCSLAYDSSEQVLPVEVERRGGHRRASPWLVPCTASVTFQVSWPVGPVDLVAQHAMPHQPSTPSDSSASSGRGQHAQGRP